MYGCEENMEKSMKTDLNFIKLNNSVTLHTYEWSILYSLIHFPFLVFLNQDNSLLKIETHLSQFYSLYLSYMREYLPLYYNDLNECILHDLFTSVNFYASRFFKQTD